MNKAKEEELKPQGKPPVEVEPQAEGHGMTRFDANIVTLSGRVVSKETGQIGVDAYTPSTASFVLNTWQSGYGAAICANVLCKTSDWQHIKGLATIGEGDVIAVLGRLRNTRDGKGLYVEVKHWHLLEPRGYRQRKDSAGADEAQESTASEAK